MLHLIEDHGSMHTLGESKCRNNTPDRYNQRTKVPDCPVFSCKLPSEQHPGALDVASLGSKGREAN